MNEMIERVARALCWKNGMDPNLTLGNDGENFLWHEYVDQAKAAIKALRIEPLGDVASDNPPATDLIHAGHDKLAGYHGTVDGAEWYKPAEVWNAMIDAALAE